MIKINPVVIYKTTYIVAILLGLGVLFNFVFNVEWNKTFRLLEDLDLRFYIIATLMYYISFIIRGLRWKILYNNLVENNCDDRCISMQGTGKFSVLVLVGWFINAITWFRLGDVYRAREASKMCNTTFSAGLGTILAERFVDLISVITLLVLSTIWYIYFGDIGLARYVIVVAFIMVIIIASIIIAMKISWESWLIIFPEKIRKFYRRFSTSTIESLKRVKMLVFLGLLSWVYEIFRLYFVLEALNLDVVLPLVIISSLGHAILSTFPTPGGFGVVEPGLVGLLAVDLDLEMSVAASVLDRSITYLSVLLFGFVSFLIWNLVMKNSFKTNNYLSSE